MVESISTRKYAIIMHKKADFRTANFRLFLCAFLDNFFREKRDGLTGLNLVAFCAAKSTRF